MCSIIVFNFFNKIYNTYRDLHIRIILNNVLKITLDNETYQSMKLFSLILINNFIYLM